LRDKVEIKVPVVEFKRAVSIAKKALPKIVLQEERGHVLCVLNGNTLNVSATNNDIKAQVSVELPEGIEDSFSFTLDPKVVEKVISKVDLDDLVLSFNKEDKTIQVYTTENRQSFTTLQSFPPEKMLTFDLPDQTEKSSYLINKEVALTALEFSDNYLAPLKENKKQYDFVIFNNGIVYSANGVNRMGFFVSTAFKDFKNFKIRKESVPFIVSVLKSLKDENIFITDTKKDIGIETEDGTVLFCCLKSGVEAPKINTDILKGESPYTLIDKNKLIKNLDRLVSSSSSSVGAGVEFELSGVGENASISFNLISNLKAVEQMNCVRVNDEGSENIKHVLEFKLFKTVLDSFSDKDVRLYINDNGKFFKITSNGEVSSIKYMAAGIGSYSKVINNG
jgi:hypothetical protein